MEKKFLGVKDLSSYLTVKEKTLYGWVNQRKIPYVKLGRCVRFEFSEIEEWLKGKHIEVYGKR